MRTVLVVCHSWDGAFSPVSFLLCILNLRQGYQVLVAFFVLCSEERSPLLILVAAALQFVPSLPFFPAKFSHSSRQVVLAKLLLIIEFLPNNKTLDKNS